MSYQVNGIKVPFTSHIILPATNNQSILDLAVENQSDVPAEGVMLTLNYCDSLRPLKADDWKTFSFVASRYPVLHLKSNGCLWTTPQSPDIPAKDFYHPPSITIGFTNQVGVTDVWHTIRVAARDKNGVKMEADALLLFKTNVSEAVLSN